jgi:branched-chain amino acid transport system substrate-binding protein
MMRRERRPAAGRWQFLVILLAVLGLVAAACGDDTDTATETANEAESSDSTAGQSGDGESGESGDSSDSDGSDGEAMGAGEFVGTIRIGAALSETGKFAVEGKDSRQGYDTWADWVNNEYGGIELPDGRYKAEIVYYDDESDADTAANLVQRLIDEDEVDFMLGPYSSGLTTGASAISEAANVLMIEGNGTSDAMFERGFENLFLVATIASDYTKSGIEAFAAQGAKTAVVAYEDTSFPTAVANGAIKHLEANGIEVLAVETYPKDPTDLTPIISKFRALEPDVFIGGGHYIDAVLFINAAEDTGFAPDGMLITVGPSNPKLVDELGQSVDGVVGPTQWESTMAYSGQWFGSAGDYAARYESLWGEAPVYQAASASASALALHIAIEQAGTTDTDAVRDALRNMSVDTFYGPISFDDRGVNTGKPMGTVQVQDGEINVVAPDGAAVAALAYPR